MKLHYLIIIFYLFFVFIVFFAGHIFDVLICRKHSSDYQHLYLGIGRQLWKSR